jgi:membrane protein YqaA with SNARE-associated domain
LHHTPAGLAGGAGHGNASASVWGSRGGHRQGALQEEWADRMEAVALLKAGFPPPPREPPWCSSAGLRHCLPSGSLSLWVAISRQWVGGR